MTRLSRQPSIKQSGFTLLEIIVVLLILALAAAFVTPNISRGLKATVVRKAARQTAAVLTRLRQDAMRGGIVTELRVQSQSNQGELVWEGGRLDFPEQVRIAEITGGWQAADGAVYVLFYPTGGGTGVNLVVEGTSGGPAFAVSANPLLGTVRVEELGE